MTKRRRKKHKKRNAALLLFILFILAAFAAVVLLEYLDFKKGKESFIFTKVLPLKSLEQKIDTYHTRLLKSLKKEGVRHDYSKDKKGIYHVNLQTDREAYNRLVSTLKEAGQPLQARLDLVEIQRKDDVSLLLYQVKLDQKLSHIILVRRKEKIKIKPPPEAKVSPKQEKEKAKKAAAAGPRVAFIIDDMGEYDIGALELKQLGIPITASILPESSRAAQEARWIAEYGLKAMIHLPMQPRNANGKTTNPHHRVITLDSDDAEIRDLVRKAKKTIPNAEGINNHEGSLVTADRDTMTRLMKIIKEEGLFFVDSRTIGSTVAYDVAKELKVKSAHKDVFLDHIATYDVSMAQIRKLVEIAQRNGKAIAIGHPRKTTLRAIKDSIPYIRSKGIEIVYVSQLLE